MFRTAVSRALSARPVDRISRCIVLRSFVSVNRFLSGTALDHNNVSTAASQLQTPSPPSATTRKNRTRSVLDIMSKGDAENRRQLYAPLLAEINQSCKHKDLERGATALSRMRAVCGHVPIQIMSRMAYLFSEAKKPDEVDKIIAEVKAGGEEVIESLYAIAVDAHSSVGNTLASVKVCTHYSVYTCLWTTLTCSISRR